MAANASVFEPGPIAPPAEATYRSISAASTNDREPPLVSRNAPGSDDSISQAPKAVGAVSSLVAGRGRSSAQSQGHHCSGRSKISCASREMATCVTAIASVVRSPVRLYSKGGWMLRQCPTFGRGRQLTYRMGTPLRCAMRAGPMLVFNSALPNGNQWFSCSTTV